MGAVTDDGALGNCFDCGAVFLFTFADTSFAAGSVVGIAGHGYTFGQSVNLASVLEPLDNFGWSVALFGDKFAAGATGDDGASNSCFNCGVVYIFGRLPTFSEDLDPPPDPLFGDLTLRSRIGDGYIGIGNINLAGMLRSGSSSLVDPLGTPDAFGASLSWDGLRLVAGAFGDNGAANDCKDCGAAYLFTFTNTVFFTGGTLQGRIGHGYTGVKDINLFGAAAPPFDIFANDDFSDQAAATVTIPVAALKAILDAGTAVALQASNDVTILSGIFINNPLGLGGHLTLRAGRSVFINADIETDGGNLTIVANESQSAGVVNLHRDPGAATLTMATGSLIDTRCKPSPVCFGDVRLTIGGDTSKTNHATGDIVLQSIIAGSLIAENLGADAGDVIIRDQIQTFDSGASLILASLNGDFRNQNTPLGQTILTTASGHFLIYSQSPGGSLFGPLLGRHRNNVVYNPADPDGTLGAPPHPFDGWFLFRKSPPAGYEQPPTESIPIQQLPPPKAEPGLPPKTPVLRDDGGLWSDFVAQMRSRGICSANLGAELLCGTAFKEFFNFLLKSSYGRDLLNAMVHNPDFQDRLLEFLRASPGWNDYVTDSTHSPSFLSELFGYALAAFARAGNEHISKQGGPFAAELGALFEASVNAFADLAQSPTDPLGAYASLLWTAMTKTYQATEAFILYRGETRDLLTQVQSAGDDYVQLLKEAAALRKAGEPARAERIEKAVNDAMFATGSAYDTLRQSGLWKQIEVANKWTIMSMVINARKYELNGRPDLAQQLLNEASTIAADLDAGTGITSWIGLGPIFKTDYVAFLDSVISRYGIGR